MLIYLAQSLLEQWLEQRPQEELRRPINFVRFDVPEIPEGYRAVVELRLEKIEDGFLFNFDNAASIQTVTV